MTDELPPLPEPAYLADDMHAFPAGTVAKWPQPNRDRMAHPIYTADQVEEIRRAAVLAERERCAKVCEAEAESLGSSGKRDASALCCAAAIRAETKSPE